jgi:hypothetical protein
MDTSAARIPELNTNNNVHNITDTPTFPSNIYLIKLHSSSKMRRKKVKMKKAPGDGCCSFKQVVKYLTNRTITTVEKRKDPNRNRS